MAERRPRRQTRPEVRQARLPRSRNATGRPRRVSRAQREAQRQRQLYIGLAAVGALLVVILIGTFIWTDLIRPRQVIASVNGTEITRQDYWHARGIALVDQVDQYSYLSGVVGGDQAAQYQNAAANAQAELNDLDGSTDINQAFLQQMVEDQLFVQYASSLGVTITDDDIDTFILNRFAPEEAPLIAPTTEPTLIPERASWATQTAVVTGPQPTETVAAAGTPGAGTPVTEGTPVSTDGVAATPGVDGAAGTPATSPTPDAAQARATAESGYSTYRNRAFDTAGIDESEYREWVALPTLARQLVTDRLESEAGQAGPQVHGAHILLSTQELADQTFAQLNSGADFGQIASTLSQDTTTAPNGGDLGWFSQYDVDDAFWAAVSGATAGQLVGPFQTPYGWEIVRVIETSPDRAYTDDQLTEVQTAVVDDWLSARAAEADISGDVDPTPTPGTTTFEPPVNAPTGVAVTPPPAGTPVAGTPEVGTPGAGTPVATDATPGLATPVNVATPAA